VNYQINIKPSAEREMRAVPANALRRVDAKIRGLADNPRPHGCVKLASLEGYRVRVGDYRIVYTVDDAARVVEIIAVDLRERVYRRGKRRS
jgi:mRNA interferase RelE/StbE